MRKMNLKKYITIALSMTMGLSMMACGNKTSDKGSSDELVYWAYEPQSLEDKNSYQQLIKDFTTKTGVKVKVSFLPKDSFNIKLNSAIANKKGPDVSYLDQPRMAEFVQDGTLLDITDKLKSSSTIKTDSFFESANDTNVFDEKQYGVPLNITTTVLLYNKKLVSEGDLPKSWAQWEKVAKKVNENTGKAAFEGIGTGGYASWYYQAFLNTAGGSLTDKAETKVTFNDAEGQAAGKFLYELYKYSPKEIRNSNAAFGNGNAAFKLAGGSDIDSLETNFPTLDFGAMLLPPKEEGGKSYSNLGGENLVIYKASEKADDAFKLVEFLSEPENAKKIAKYTGNFSSLKELASTDNEKKNVVLEQMHNTVGRPKLNGWITVNDSYIATALENILNGQDIKQNLDTAAQQANAVLFKGGK